MIKLRINTVNAILMLVAMALAFNGCSPSQQDKETEQRAYETRLEESKVYAFATRLKASDNWIETLPKRRSASLFTLELSRAIVRTNDQPVLIRMSLEDVQEKAGIYTAWFAQEIIKTNTFFGLRLILECDKKQADKLLSTKSLTRPYFAVVAVINSVSRPELTLTLSEREEDLYDIDAVNLPNTFIGRGRCVDFYPIRGTTISNNVFDDIPIAAPNEPSYAREMRPNRAMQSQPVPIPLRPCQFPIDDATRDLAIRLKIAGWTYIMPQPKSAQAAWGNRDGRTTWWEGYWINNRKNTSSATIPNLDASGQFVGDNRGVAFWRKGGAPSLPKKIEWLCSESGGIEPQ